MSGYRAAPGLSGSVLGDLARSPAHFKERMDNPKEATEGMIIGSLCHTLVLEPDYFGQQYLVAPEGLRFDERQAAYLKLLRDADGRQIVKPDWYIKAKSMAEVARSTPQVLPIFQAYHLTEHEVYWEEDGVKCKGKLDMFLRELYVVVDYKTTTDASMDKFYWKVNELGYLLQLAHYQAGIRVLTGRVEFPGILIIAQEQDSPYVVQVYEIPQELIDAAHAKRKELLQVYKECMSTGVWGGYSDRMMKLERK